MSILAPAEVELTDFVNHQSRYPERYVLVSVDSASCPPVSRRPVGQQLTPDSQRLQTKWNGNLVHSRRTLLKVAVAARRGTVHTIDVCLGQPAAGGYCNDLTEGWELNLICGLASISEVCWFVQKTNPKNNG